MRQPLVIIGAAGAGREALDVIDAINAFASPPPYEVRGVLDDRPSGSNLDKLKRRNTVYLGTTEDWLSCAVDRDVRYVIGIGDPAVRQRLATRFHAAGQRSPVLTHPSATIGLDVQLGDGTIICAGVRVANNIRFGCHVHLNSNVTVGHDCRIGDFVSVNPLAAIGGDCMIGRGAALGAGSVILQGLRVGDGATVGASACVTHDVAARTTVKGVPAR